MKTKYTKEELETYGGFNAWRSRLEEIGCQREKIEQYFKEEEKTIAKWLFSNIINLREQTKFQDMGVGEVIPNVTETGLVDLEKRCLETLKEAGEDPREHNYYFGTELSKTWNKRITEYLKEL